MLYLQIYIVLQNIIHLFISKAVTDMAAKYIRIANELSAQLRTMQHSGINRLPSEAELCTRYDCSRQTIRSALAVLEEKGIIIKKHGSGSYIADNISPRSRQIAVIVPDKNEYIYPYTIRDIQNTLSLAGYTVCAYSTDGLFTNERTILTTMLNEPPAGIIIEATNNLLPCYNSDLLDRIRQAGIPLIYLYSSYDPSDNTVCIKQDNYSGGYSLVEHLATKGHKNICGIMLCNDTRGIERYRGCVQASLDLGLNFQEHNYFWFSPESRRHLLDNNNDILRSFINDYLKSCTAVICYNDEIAFHLIRTLNAAGIDVPGKLSVVSFDSSYYSLSGNIGITSLGHEPHAVGTAAAESILSLIAGKTCSCVTIPWYMTIRESG